MNEKLVRFFSIPRNVVVTLLVILLFFPIHIHYIEDVILSINSWLWNFNITNGTFRFHIFSEISYSIFLYGLYIVFIYQTGRYFKKDISKTRVFIWGLVSLLPQILFFYINLVAPLFSPVPLPIIYEIPIPLSLLIGVILISLFPFPKDYLDWSGHRTYSDSWHELDNP